MSDLKTDLTNANLANANLQGQVAVQVGHGQVMDALHGLESQRQKNEINQLREAAKAYLPPAVFFIWRFA